MRHCLAHSLATTVGATRAPGEQQPEVDHDYWGEDSRTGLHLGRHYRDTGRFLSYRLRAPAHADTVQASATVHAKRAAQRPLSRPQSTSAACDRARLSAAVSSAG